jgi:hypothetical protein
VGKVELEVRIFVEKNSFPTEVPMEEMVAVAVIS